VNPLTKARLILIATVACLLVSFLSAYAGPLGPLSMFDGNG
jgi:hypothetical protein